MSTERRRLQFGLRKLLLWTAVLAFFLGFLRMQGLDTIAATIVVCWAAAVTVFRMITRPRAAFWFSAFAGAIAGALEFILRSVSGQIAVGHVFTLSVMFAGFIGGCIFFPLVEAVFRAVNWADDLMRVRSDQENAATEKAKRSGLKSLRFRRPTVIEWLVLILIAGMLAALISCPATISAPRSQLAPPSKTPRWVECSETHARVRLTGPISSSAPPRPCGRIPPPRRAR
jgi:hypothetical protein